MVFPSRSVLSRAVEIQVRPSVGDFLEVVFAQAWHDLLVYALPEGRLVREVMKAKRLPRLLIEECLT
jgi:hypothetical protein